MNNNQRKKICSCGRIIPVSTKCDCKKRIKRPKADIERNKVLTTYRYAKFRRLIIERDLCCIRCVVKFREIRSSNLEVHHIKPRIKYPELVYDESNCITLCKPCNLELGTKEELDFEYEAPTENIASEYVL